jgi:hypothetical protein
MKEAEERELKILALLNAHDWQRGPLVVEMEQAVDIRVALMDNRALRRQIMHLRSTAAQLAPVIRQLWDAALKHVMPVWTMLAPYLEPGAPVGAEWEVETAAGYETDPVPAPKDDDHGTCTVCGGEIEFIVEAASNGDALDTWWAHLVHPADGHQAQLGGPA